MKKKAKSISKSNRQLIGFLILLLVFAALLYTILITYMEGNLFKEQTNITKPNQDKGMTTVSIVYKNSNSTSK